MQCQESITVFALRKMQMDLAQLESVWQVGKTGLAEVVTEVTELRLPIVTELNVRNCRERKLYTAVLLPWVVLTLHSQSPF